MWAPHSSCWQLVIEPCTCGNGNLLRPSNFLLTHVILVAVTCGSSMRRWQVGNDMYHDKPCNIRMKQTERIMVRNVSCA